MPNRPHARATILPIALLLTVAELLTAGAARAAEPSALPPSITLVPGHWTPGAQPDGNSVVFEGPDGLVLLDTGRHIEHVQRVQAALQARGKPLRWIVNSHWHLDHIGGNAELRAAHPQARLLASDAIAGARTGFLARYRRQLAAMQAQPDNPAEPLPMPRPAIARELAIIDAHVAQTPDVSVQASGERILAGRRFVVGLERDAVTAGDLWLLDPEARVLASGDLVTLPAPFLDTACPARWQAALQRLAEQPFDRLIPGHGPVLDRAGFERWRRGFDGLLRCAASNAPAQSCQAGWLDALGDLVPPAQQGFTHGLLAYYLDQHLRGPEAAAAAARNGCPAA